MQDFIVLFNQYVRSELLVVVPVLYVMAKILSTSTIENSKIPIILFFTSLLLAALYTFAIMPVNTPQKLLMAIFSSFIQGVLLSGSTVFSGILGEIAKLKKNATIKSKQP